MDGQGPRHCGVLHFSEELWFDQRLGLEFITRPLLFGPGEGRFITIAFSPETFGA